MRWYLRALLRSAAITKTALIGDKKSSPSFDKLILKAIYTSLLMVACLEQQQLGYAVLIYSPALVCKMDKRTLFASNQDNLEVFIGIELPIRLVSFPLFKLFNRMFAFIEVFAELPLLLLTVSAM